MVIGIDASRANRAFKTGTEWYSYYLIINLIKIDQENRYVLYSDQPLSEAFLSQLNLTENTRVKVKVLKWPFKYLWTLGRLSLEMIFWRPDVLFVPAHALPLFVPKKTITTIHDIAFVQNDDLYSQNIATDGFFGRHRFLNFLLALLTWGRYRLKSTDYLNWSSRSALKRAAKVIAVSNFTRREILKYYPKTSPAKIKVVYNGFADDLYRKLEDEKVWSEVLKKYGLVQPFFLYIGRLEKKKNIKTLIEGFSILKDKRRELKEKLVLIGRPGFCYDQIKYLIEELDLMSEVIILGWVEENDLPAILNRAEALVLPSFYEGFGIPLIQSMACETPLLLSDIEVFHEIAQNAALFFDHFDPADLAAKMEIIIDDQSRRQNLIEAGKKIASEFSWKKCATETLREINSL